MGYIALFCEGVGWCCCSDVARFLIGISGLCWYVSVAVVVQVWCYGGFVGV